MLQGFSTTLEFSIKKKIKLLNWKKKLTTFKSDSEKQQPVKWNWKTKLQDCSNK